jgi:hypothetical protein
MIPKKDYIIIKMSRQGITGRFLRNAGQAAENMTTSVHWNSAEKIKKGGIKAGIMPSLPHNSNLIGCDII